MAEPDIYSGPVRMWQNGDLPVAGCLAEIRPGMEVCEDRLVDEFYKRYKFVLDATIFKEDLDEVEAPERQAANRQRALDRARQIAPEDDLFQKFIWDLWGTAVIPKSVALQRKAFEWTGPVSETDYVKAKAPGARLLTGFEADPNSPLPAFEQKYGMPFYELLRQNPAQGELFNRKMDIDVREMLTPEAIAEIPLPRRGVVADIGGGLGYLLSTIKAQAPELTTVLCEQPTVIEQAKGVGYLIDELQSVNIFEDNLLAADVYILRRVLHNLKDEEAIKLLQNILKAAPEGSELRMVDVFLNAGSTGTAHALEQNDRMKLLFGAKQHSISEARALFKAAGWQPLPRITRLTDEILCLSARKE